ncbi:MAG: succinate dehydrogenase, hydrophobic membrane anchor protein [Alphaproteobacteria bacterium]|nr:succinate dehydrogenase, hydrophobic membrane anchor protein [Alphaproteobacteria bacterium]
MTLRSPLGAVRGLGSAKDGTHHWWMQRVTAVALVPLTIWFVIGVIGHVGAEQSAMQAWMASPINAAMMIFYVATAFYHGQLGMQVVIEDYVHEELAKVAAIIVVKLTAALFGLTSVIAVLMLAMGR